MSDEFSIPTHKTRHDKSDQTDISPDSASLQVTTHEINSEANAYIEVDLQAIVNNYRAIDKLNATCQIFPVVKSDGYGLGASPITQFLNQEAGCENFFVARVTEALAILDDLENYPPVKDLKFYVFYGPSSSSLGSFSDERIIPVLNSLHQATLWSNYYPGRPAALQIDTGMNRLGAPLDELANIRAISSLNITTLISHLACAGTPDNALNAQQRAKFYKIALDFPEAKLSLAATGAAFMAPSYHASIIRLGVGLYGYTASGKRNSTLSPSAKLLAPIIQIRTIKAGDIVGYDGTWKAQRPTTIATVGLGYGDGYPRSLSNKATAMIHNKECPLVGRVSMDMITLDITDINKSDPVAVGDFVEFFGPNLPLEAIANAADTIPYEIIASLSSNLKRVYRTC